MNQRLHIILTGEEGRARSFAVPKSKIKAAVYLSIALLVGLIGGSIAGADFFVQNRNLQCNVNSLEQELHAVRLANNNLQDQVVRLDEEKKTLLADAVDKLHEKNQLMESILSTVGFDVTVEESQQNTGGLFTQITDETPDDLIFKAERYLEMIQYVPLGAPAPGVITSKYGRRRDPINSRPAFHKGVDIRGRMGTDVKATADGKVYELGNDKGVGRFVVLDHKNGFRTSFGHLKKILIKRGQEVTRGQVIGLIGNSGRSTGPHVHYEVIYKKKLVNPIKYMKIAKYISPENKIRYIFPDKKKQ
jgi:murein DD-endopeptidase MepM/ murein hydrolase activator NlpD